MKTRYKVTFQHIGPYWGEVWAEDETEALAKAKRGDFIDDTVDSEPGKHVWKKVRVEEVK